MTWLAFKQDLTATEHTSLGDAIQVSPIFIFLELNGVWYNNGFPNPAYFVEMYDSSGLRLDCISMGGWFLSNLSISGHYPRTQVNFSVTDPLGHTGSRSFGNFRDGLRSALVYLRAASSFSSMADYKQNDPNEAFDELMKGKETQIQVLEKENRALIHEIEQNKTQIDLLSSQITKLNIQITAIKSALSPNTDILRSH
ncbi:MAG: hypothetical protein IPH31_03560 [Lewinellaceae bacterium]|nr:hypothetical protein [Lewinellaceae bacterium]